MITLESKVEGYLTLKKKPACPSFKTDAGTEEK